MKSSGRDLPPERDNSEAIDEVIATTGDVVGGTVAAIIGMLVAGPPGAIGGAVGGPVISRSLQRVAHEVKHRLLGPREEIRIDATLRVAATRIKDNFASGQALRDDDFFQGDTRERSAADEIFEGVLLAAQREYEERKVPLHGRLLANIAFHEDVSRAQANQLIRLSERLSYRQLCLLSLFGQKHLYPLRQQSWRGIHGGLTAALVSVLQDVYELSAQYMVVNPGIALIDIVDVDPGHMTLVGTGILLYNLMELWNIDVVDLQEVAAILA